MSTAPQRERSDRPKVTRRLHGRSHKSHFVWKFTGKMAEDTSAASVLCEPAQSKCTLRCVFEVVAVIT